MSYTDDDLARLKERIAFTGISNAEEIPRLLARLEAAEEALATYESSEGDVIMGENILTKWRKTCGK